MKTLIVLVVGLLAVGCEKKLTPEQKLRDSVLGEYEHKFENGFTYKLVFLDNGIREFYLNGEKTNEGKWSVVKEEIHVKGASGLIEVYRINKDKSITPIAEILDGKRTDYSKEYQSTFKKLKE